MDNLCREFWVCSLIPPEWHWIMPIVMPLLFALLVGIPISHILHRAGRTRWWTLIAFIPIINLIGLWVFAFSRWPRFEKLPS